MRWKKISDAVVRRLPLYLRVLDELAKHKDTKLISSHDLGERAGVGPALVRKDLAWFGEFGKQGVGYEIEYLRSELRKILNLEHEIHVVLVGVGSLGAALARYNLRRYEEDESFNLNITALLDTDEKRWGEEHEGLPIRPMEDLDAVVEEHHIQVGIITVPAAQAQSVADVLVRAGVRGILNFAPVRLSLPEGVHLASADMSLELQRLAYYLQEE